MPPTTLVPRPPPAPAPAGPASLTGLDGLDGLDGIGALLQPIVAFVIVLGAVVFLIGHFTGAFARFRRKRTPDVPVGRLVRRKKDDAPDDCCR